MSHSPKHGAHSNCQEDKVLKPSGNEEDVVKYSHQTTGDLVEAAYQYITNSFTFDWTASTEVINRVEEPSENLKPDEIEHNHKDPFLPWHELFFLQHNSRLRKLYNPIQEYRHIIKHNYGIKLRLLLADNSTLPGQLFQEIFKDLEDSTTYHYLPISSWGRHHHQSTNNSRGQPDSPMAHLSHLLYKTLASTVKPFAVQRGKSHTTELSQIYDIITESSDNGSHVVVIHFSDTYDWMERCAFYVGALAQITMSLQGMVPTNDSDRQASLLIVAVMDPEIYHLIHRTTDSFERIMLPVDLVPTDSWRLSAIRRLDRLIDFLPTPSTRGDAHTEKGQLKLFRSILETMDQKTVNFIGLLTENKMGASLFLVSKFVRSSEFASNLVCRNKNCRLEPSDLNIGRSKLQQFLRFLIFTYNDDRERFAFDLELPNTTTKWNFFAIAPSQENKQPESAMITDCWQSVLIKARVLQYLFINYQKKPPSTQLDIAEAFSYLGYSGSVLPRALDDMLDCRLIMAPEFLHHSHTVKQKFACQNGSAGQNIPLMARHFALFLFQGIYKEPEYMAFYPPGKYSARGEFKEFANKKSTTSAAILYAATIGLVKVAMSESIEAWYSILKGPVGLDALLKVTEGGALWQIIFQRHLAAANSCRKGVDGLAAGDAKSDSLVLQRIDAIHSTLKKFENELCWHFNPNHLLNKILNFHIITGLHGIIEHEEFKSLAIFNKQPDASIEKHCWTLTPVIKLYPNSSALLDTVMLRPPEDGDTKKFWEQLTKKYSILVKHLKISHVLINPDYIANWQQYLETNITSSKVSSVNDSQNMKIHIVKVVQSMDDNSGCNYLVDTTDKTWNYHGCDTISKTRKLYQAAKQHRKTAVFGPLFAKFWIDMT
jgi:hypothetical protein